VAVNLLTFFPFPRFKRKLPDHFSADNLLANMRAKNALHIIPSRNILRRSGIVIHGLLRRSQSNVIPNTPITSKIIL
jgi:hypothetical protein